MHPTERLLIMSMHLDSPTSGWYQGLFVGHKIGSWVDFIVALQHHFSPSKYDDRVSLLSHITQKGFVLDYQATFEELAIQVGGFSSHNLMNIFIGGLHPRLCHQLQRPLE